MAGNEYAKTRWKLYTGTISYTHTTFPCVKMLKPVTFISKYFVCAAYRITDVYEEIMVNINIIYIL